MRRVKAPEGFASEVLRASRRNICLVSSPGQQCKKENRPPTAAVLPGAGDFTQCDSGINCKGQMTSATKVPGHFNIARGDLTVSMDFDAMNSLP